MNIFPARCQRFTFHPNICTSKALSPLTCLSLSFTKLSNPATKRKVSFQHRTVDKSQAPTNQPGGGGGIDFITLLAHALRKIFTSYRLVQVTFPVRRAHTQTHIHTSCLSYFPFSFAKQNPFGRVLNFSSQPWEGKQASNFHPKGSDTRW